MDAPLGSAKDAARSKFRSSQRNKCGGARAARAFWRFVRRVRFAAAAPSRLRPAALTRRRAARRPGRGGPAGRGFSGPAGRGAAGAPFAPREAQQPAELAANDWRYDEARCVPQFGLWRASARSLLPLTTQRGAPQPRAG